MIVGMNNYCFSERLEHFTLWDGDVVFSVRYEVNLNGSINGSCTRLYCAVSPRAYFESVGSVECTLTFVRA
jgi:hypothetical protein